MLFTCLFSDSFVATNFHIEKKSQNKKTLGYSNYVHSMWMVFEKSDRCLCL